MSTCLFSEDDFCLTTITTLFSIVTPLTCKTNKLLLLSKVIQCIKAQIWSSHFTILNISYCLVHVRYIEFLMKHRFNCDIIIHHENSHWCSQHQLFDGHFLSPLILSTWKPCVENPNSIHTIFSNGSDPDQRAPMIKVSWNWNVWTFTTNYIFFSPKFQNLRLSKVQYWNGPLFLLGGERNKGEDIEVTLLITQKLF